MGFKNNVKKSNFHRTNVEVKRRRTRSIWINPFENYKSITCIILKKTAKENTSHTDLWSRPLFSAYRRVHEYVNLFFFPPFSHFENRAKTNVVWLTSSSRPYSVRSIHVYCFARLTTYACDYADNVRIYIGYGLKISTRYAWRYTAKPQNSCRHYNLQHQKTAFARVPIYYFVYTSLPICNVSFYEGRRSAVVRLKRSCARVPGRDRSRPRVQQNALERCFIFDRFPFFPEAVYCMP